MSRHIPMLFKAQMIRAMLDGRKTETRRIFKNAPPDATAFWREADADGFFWCSVADGIIHPQHFGTQTSPGDLIWCKETWRPQRGHGNWDLLIRYNEDGSERHVEDGDADTGDWNWPKAADRGNVSPLFMPKWASRLTLRVIGYRIERLHDITEAGAQAEGIQRLKSGRGFYDVMAGSGAVHLDIWHRTARDAYAQLWDDINGEGAWDENPWVDVTSYEVIERNILDVAA